MDNVRKRKGRTEELCTRVFGICMTEVEHETLKKLAKEQNMTMSEYVRSLIFGNTEREDEVMSKIMRKMFSPKGLNIIKAISV